MIVEIHTIDQAAQLQRGLAELLIRGARDDPDRIWHIILATEARAWDLVFPPLSQLQRQYQAYR